MKLDVLTREQAQLVRKWRNEEMAFLRTPYMLTAEMQDMFYDNVVSNRDSNHRYFALIENGEFVGMGGLTNIEWENGCAEISLIISPHRRSQGFGKAAVWVLLSHAFDNMRLTTVYGEVYGCGNVKFWEAILDGEGIVGKWYNSYNTLLKRRKRFNGVYFDSIWFAFWEKEE